MNLKDKAIPERRPVMPKYQVRLTKDGKPSKRWSPVVDAWVHPVNELGDEYLYYTMRGLSGIAKPGEWRKAI